MKIMINYDLIDKVREAKTGFSLHKYTTVVGFTNGLAIPAMLLAAYIVNANYISVLKSILRMFGYSLFYNAVYAFAFSSFRKGDACEQLANLSNQLNKVCVETDVDLLKNAYQYDVKYRVNFDSFPPKLEQQKYIMVPVYNDWGNNERSLLQEHIVGTRTYTLSYGEPQKKKVYSYITSRNFSGQK